MQSPTGLIAIFVATELISIAATGAAALGAQAGGNQKVSAQESINGEWLTTSDVYGNPLYQRMMTLKVENGKLTGSFAGDKLEGTVEGNALHFLARDQENNTSEFTGSFSGGKIAGKVVRTNGSDPRLRDENELTANASPGAQSWSSPAA